VRLPPKINAAYLIASRLLLHTLSRPKDDDVWAWLYQRVYNPSSRDYQNVELAHFLVFTALRTDEPYRAVKVYRDFRLAIEPRLRPDLHEKLLASIFIAEIRDELPESVFSSVKLGPDHNLIRSRE